MKRKYKILIGIAIAGVLLLPVGYKAGQYILIRRFAGWRVDGIAAAKAGDNAKAAEILSRYLQRRPQDIDALSYYAHSRELAEEPNGQNLAEAMVAYKALIGLDPTRLDDRRHLLELYARLERRPEALDMANSILKQYPRDVQTLHIATELLLQVHQYHPALDVATRWASLAPDDLQAHLDRLTARGLLSQSPEVILADADEVCRPHPDDPKFELIEGYAYLAAGKEPEAVKLLKKAAAHPNLPDDVATSLVQRFDSIGMIEDSLAVMKTMAATGHNPTMRDALAKRLWEMSRWPEASLVLASVDLSSPSSDPTLIALRAMTSARLNKKDDVAACRAALASRKQTICKVWNAILDRVLNGTAVDDRQFIADCRSAMLTGQDNVYITYYYGDALSRIGEPDLAIQAWRNAAAGTLTWEAPTVRLVDALVQHGRPQEALQVATSVVRRGNVQPALAVSLARAWTTGIETGEVAYSDELLTLLNQMQKQMPYDDQTQMMRINLLGRRGVKFPADKESAISLARAAISRTPPPSEQMLISLASISRRYDLGIADEAFAKSLQTYGPTTSLAYAQAVDLHAKGKSDEGLKLFDDLASKSGKAQELPWKLARAEYLDTAARPEASAAWKQLAEAHPKDITVQQAVVAARAVRGDWTIQEPAIERLHQLQGEQGLEWREAKARLMVDAPRNDSDYQQASIILEALIKKNPNLPDLYVLMGRALAQMKRTDAAIEKFTLAAKLDPYSVPIALQLASLLQSRGEFDRVSKELDRIAPHLRTDAERHDAAVLFAEQGKPEQAAKLLEQPADSASPSQVSDANDLLLATLYNQQHQFDKVEALLTKLLTHPTFPAVRFASFYYSAHAQPDKAAKALALLDTLKLNPGVKELFLGDFSLQNGDLAKAESSYRAATERAPANPAGWHMLANAQVDAARPDDVIATLTAAAKSLPADESFKTLSAKVSLIRDSIADQGSRAVAADAVRDPSSAASALDLLQILANWRTSNDTEAAANALQEFVDRYPNYLLARTQLIDCYQAMGRKNDAIVAAQRAITAFPNDPKPAEIEFQLCADANRWDAARQAADTWRKRSAANPMPAEFALARADLGQHEYDAALRRVMPYLSGDPSKPKPSDAVEIFALAAVNNGNAAAAAAKLWPEAVKSSEWRLRWIQIAVETNDPAQATQWLDRVATIIPENAANELVALGEGYDRIAAAHPDPAVTAKSTAIFNRLLAQKDLPVPIILSSAVHFEHSNDPATAEKLYRRVLSLDPHNWVAQNNLAMLLFHNGSDLATAKSLAASAAQLQPHVATVHDTLATILAKSGDGKSAADNMLVAVRLEPDNALWRLRLAQYLLASGDSVGATRAINDIDDRRLDLRALPADAQQQLSQIQKNLHSTKRG